MSKLVSPYSLIKKGSKEYRETLRSIRRNYKKYGAKFDNSELWCFDSTIYKYVYNHKLCKHRNNFPLGDIYRPDLGEKSPQELYNITDEEYEEFIDLFDLYSGVEWGFHTITKIQEVTLGEEIL